MKGSNRLATAVRVLSLGVLSLGACTIAPIDFEGRRCPCVSGYVCDEARDVCVRGDAGASDASSSDVPLLDVPWLDALDAFAPHDAGLLDDTACDDAFAGAIFCSGFENAALTDWDGTTTVGGGVAVRSTTTTYRGAGAFRSAVSAGAARGEITADLTAPIVSGDVHVRFYARLGPAPVSFLLVGLAFGRALSPDQGLFLRLGPGDVTLQLVSSTASEYVATSDIPRDRWVCVQLGVTVGASGSVSLAFDGTEVVSRGAIDTMVVGGYDRLRAGISWSSTMNTSGELFVDEVVVDDQPVPCD